MRTRNLKRAAMTYCRAFSDHHFHESQDVFLAIFRDAHKGMQQTILDEREKRQRAIEFSERNAQTEEASTES